MRNKGSLSKLVWLLLVAAFVAIAGGGCGGSSSGGGGGDDVTNVGKSEHPFADFLREHADQETLKKIKEKIHIVGNKTTIEELAAAMPDLQAEFEAGKIIGVFGPRQELIDGLHSGLGVNVINAGPAAGSLSAAAADEPLSEFFMIAKRNGIVFENEFHYVPGSADVTPPLSDDEDGEDMPLLEKLRTKADHYPEFAEKIAAWHDRVAELVEEYRADRTSATTELRAAASPYWTLSSIAQPLYKTWNVQYEDVKAAKGVKGTDILTFKPPLLKMEAWIWSAYSYATDSNIYLIKTKGSMNPGDNYYETFEGAHDQRINSTDSFRSGAEMRGVSEDKVSLLAHLPHSLNKATSYNQSFSVNLGANVGGSVGYDAGTKFDVDIGGAGSIGTNTRGELKVDVIPGVDGHINGSLNGGLSGGVAFTHGSSWEVYDFEAVDQTDVPHAKPYVEYVFNHPNPNEGKYHSGGGIECSPTSSIAKGNFTSDESWVWAVERSADSYKFDHHILYRAGHLIGAGTTTHINMRNGTYYSCRWSDKYTTMPLPIPPTFCVEGNQLIVNSNGRVIPGQEVQVGVLSTGKWKAECDVKWVELTETSGDKTGDSARRFIVDIKPNPDPHVRTGHITFTGPNDPNGKPQTAVIEVQQGAKK